MSADAFLSPMDLEPQGFARVASGLYKIRLRLSQQLLLRAQEWSDSLEQQKGDAVERAGQLARLLDPAVPMAVARYRVQEGPALTGQATAALTVSEAWAGELQGIAAKALDETHRQELSGAWARAGLQAHAAVAVQGVLTQELMALGAPPELLARGHALGLEWIRRAEGAFALGRAFGGQPLGPAAWPELRSLASLGRDAGRPEARVRLAQTVLLQGCLNGNFAEAIAVAGEMRAAPGPVQRHLREVSATAGEEGAWAWEASRWLLGGHEDAAVGLARVLRSIPPRLPERPLARGLRPDVLQRNGLVGDTVRRAVFLSCRAQVVERASGLLDRVPVQRTRALPQLCASLG
jgi:hypothetical protein